MKILDIYRLPRLVSLTLGPRHVLVQRPVCPNCGTEMIESSSPFVGESNLPDFLCPSHGNADMVFLTAERSDVPFIAVLAVITEPQP